MGAVGGVLLDESVLLSDDGSGNPRLKPGAEILLRRLRYSNLRVGFCHHEDLSAVKRGALPIYPTQNGLIFVPLTFEIPLVSQLQDVDAVLHKATDEIVCFDPHISTHFSHGISFSKGMQELERWLS
ncbi:hypothetical protein BHE74_00005007 [Ensete ventricosum]|uniref:Uncharacterized protein n=1 Tax=Ensete ventricosum TaxID=4639 RepID=A0A427B8F5_ENSVE|nr:hypothetical protein B296_00012708 [Ensete ventricosum]RWW86227.1 hypothetical protein BHE74_00005007 [Ensete ventricosum]RZR77091.1 hypothetical protein BHM03_00002067 [Ensete ventricosum]